MRVHRAALVVAVFASLTLTLAGPAQATRMLGTKGPDKIVGTAKADVIKARAGNDRVRGGRGRDRLLGGRGADRLNAVDGLRDRLVRGGPGKDVCRVDPTDRANTKGCETVKVARGRGPGTGGPGAPGPGSGGPGAPGPGAGGPGGPLVCAAPAGGRQACGRRPGAGCPGGTAAELQRSVLRAHDLHQRFGGWLDRRRAADLDRGGLRRPPGARERGRPADRRRRSRAHQPGDNGVRRHRPAADRRRGNDRGRRCRQPFAQGPAPAARRVAARRRRRARGHFRGQPSRHNGLTRPAPPEPHDPPGGRARPGPAPLR